MLNYSLRSDPLKVIGGWVSCISEMTLHWSQDLQHIPKTHRYLSTPSPKSWVVYNLLIDHVALSHVLDLAVHLVTFFEWVKGVILRLFYYYHFFLRVLIHG